MALYIVLHIPAGYYFDDWLRQSHESQVLFVRRHIHERTRSPPEVSLSMISSRGGPSPLAFSFPLATSTLSSSRTALR